MGRGIRESGQETRLSHSLCDIHHVSGPSALGESPIAKNGAFEDLVIGYHKSALSTIKCCTNI